MRSVCKALEPYGDSMRTYALFRRKLGKLNVQAKICTPPGGAMLAKICIVLLACRLGAATFYRHDTLVTAAVQLGSLLVSLPLSHTPSSPSSPSYPLLPPPRYLRKFASLTPQITDLGPTCENMHSGDILRSGLQKYALRQNHTIPVCLEPFDPLPLIHRTRACFTTQLTHCAPLY